MLQILAVILDRLLEGGCGGGDGEHQGLLHLLPDHLQGLQGQAPSKQHEKNISRRCGFCAIPNSVEKSRKKILKVKQT